MDRYLIQYFRAGGPDDTIGPRRELPEHDPNIRAILLDRLLDGPRSSACLRSRLLALPSELLAMIVEFVGDFRGNLSNLALVNSDCRALAYSLRFCALTLDRPSRVGLRFLGYSSEPWPRTRSTFRDALISLCVRSVTFKPTPDPNYHDRLLSQLIHQLRPHHRLSENNPAERTAWEQAQLAKLFSANWTWIHHVDRGEMLKVVRVMPNLQTVACSDLLHFRNHFLGPERSMIRTLLWSFVQRLELRNLEFPPKAVELVMNLPSLPAQIPLRTLCMDVQSHKYPHWLEQDDVSAEEAQIMSNFY